MPTPPRSAESPESSDNIEGCGNAFDETTMAKVHATRSCTKHHDGDYVAMSCSFCGANAARAPKYKRDYTFASEDHIRQHIESVHKAEIKAGIEIYVDFRKLKLNEVMQLANGDKSPIPVVPAYSKVDSKKTDDS